MPPGHRATSWSKKPYHSTAALLWSTIYLTKLVGTFMETNKIKNFDEAVDLEAGSTTDTSQHQINRETDTQHKKENKGTLTEILGECLSKYEWDENIDPTVRRSSLRRTPTKTGKQTSDSEDDSQTSKHNLPNSSGEESDVWLDETVQTVSNFKLTAKKDKKDRYAIKIQKSISPIKKKRKRESQESNCAEEMSKEMSEVMVVLDKLTKKTEELRKQIKGSSKTKIEIKSTSRQLNGIVDALNRKVAVLKSSYNNLTAKYENDNKALNIKEAETATVEHKTKNDIGIQADEEEIKKELANLKENIYKDIEHQLANKSGWEGLEKIIDYEWPNSCFTNTEHIAQEGTNQENGDMAVILDPEAPLVGELAEDVKYNFPEITILMEERLTEGNIEYIKTNKEIILSKGKKKESSRTLYLLPYNANQDGVNDIRKLYEIINKLEMETKEHGCQKIKMVVIGKIELDYVRKCVEYIFRGTETKIGIKMGKPNKRSRQKSVGGKQRQQTEKVIIKSEGRQYADILRSVKNNVNIDDVGVKIKTIKKTAKGDVMIEVQGGKDKAEALKREIQSKNNDTQVSIKNNDDVIFIHDIDGDVQEQEIVEEIRKSVGDATNEDIKILSVRPNQKGSQNATVALRKGLAKDLIEKGNIKIGWVSCRVRARVHIIRCYKCLAFGHHSLECTGEDKTKTCLRCGKEDHKAKDCKNISFCLTCKTEGHRADQTKCPTYRKLVTDQAWKIATASRGRLRSVANQ